MPPIFLSGAQHRCSELVARHPLRAGNLAQ